MSQPVKCLDCALEFDVNYECCNELSNTPMEHEEDIWMQEAGEGDMEVDMEEGRVT